jgi:3-oxoacid CoA-transferase
MDKVVASAAGAVGDIGDGAAILVGGFGVIQNWPVSLLVALRDHGARGLTLICNTPGVGPFSPQILAERGQVSRLIATFASYPTRATAMADGIRAGRIALELVPQGTLVERVRAGGAGLAAFYTPTGVGTEVARGKEVRGFEGRDHVLETALRADVALIRGHRADRVGNVTYRRGSRNFHPVFATAARCTIAEVEEIVDPGSLDPESIGTPGIYVDRVIRTEHPFDVPRVLELSRAYGKEVPVEPRPAAGDGPPGLPPDLMARKAAMLLREGEYVNLGLGLPTLISNFVATRRDVTLHAENGLLGYGPLVAAGDEDLDLYNAGGQLVAMLPGASCFHSADAFAMARGGRVTTVVLGGFQVSATGDLANWNVPATGVGGIGGAMDLAAGRARVLVVMYHTTREGTPKLLPRCTYPVTAVGCVAAVVTDLAVIEVGRDGFVLRELAPGVSADDVRARTAAPLRLADDLRPMAFD